MTSGFVSSTQEFVLYPCFDDNNNNNNNNNNDNDNNNNNNNNSLFIRSNNVQLESRQK